MNETDMETEQPPQEFKLSEEEIADVRKRMGILEFRRQNLTASVPDFKEGGCIYDHFFKNTQQEIYGFFEGLESGHIKDYKTR